MIMRSLYLFALNLVCLALASTFITPSIAYAQKSKKVATREQARVCLKQEDELGALKVKVDKNLRVNAASVKEVEARSKSLDELQAKVDKEDEKQVDDFNVKTREHNAFVDTVNQQAQAMKIDTETYERDRSKFNNECAALTVSAVDRKVIAKEKK
jgi:hypothetical protein